MVGLPGSGKTTWAIEACKLHADKKYYILGTNLIMDKMKVWTRNQGLTRFLKILPPHTTWLRDWYCDACVTSPCTQVLQSRNWLMDRTPGSRSEVVVYNYAFEIAKCKVRMRQSRSSSICSCSVWHLLVRPLSRAVYGGLYRNHYCPPFCSWKEWGKRWSNSKEIGFTCWPWGVDVQETFLRMGGNVLPWERHANNLGEKAFSN